MDLFAHTQPQTTPLADRMRPTRFDDVVGQDKLAGPDGILRNMVTHKHFQPFVLWGPPGTGKTTLAQIVAREAGYLFHAFSGVMSSMKDIKPIMIKAKSIKDQMGTPTMVFVDEIHRFNKAQQDAFLPYVEHGHIVLTGATTENPSFEINNALLSRMRVLVVDPLSPQNIVTLLNRALQKDAWVLAQNKTVKPDALEKIARIAHADARQALNLLETCLSMAEKQGVTTETVEEVMQSPSLYFDKNGEEHFNIISALHKSMRNSDVQASLYWLGRMLEAGEDPLYVVRRMIRFASEDIGLADTHALAFAMAVKDTVHFIGMPEGKLALAQLAIYLATAPKSNAVYRAYQNVQRDIAQGDVYPVPLHIRNAPTKLMKDLSYGKGYRYAHDEEDSVTDMTCLPEEIKDRVFYSPSMFGDEKDLWQKMQNIKEKKLKKH